MTSSGHPGQRIIGTLATADGKGVVRMEDRFDTDIDDLWSALTDPSRLARWLGEFEGDLRLGGEFRARFLASGWEGTGRVEACEPPRRLQFGSPDVGYRGWPGGCGWGWPGGCGRRMTMRTAACPRRDRGARAS